MTTTTTRTPTVLYDLAVAYDGSYYTICGTGGDLTEWVEGYDKLLAERDIGKPVAWYQTTGQAVNDYAGDVQNPRDLFQPDLTILLFPLDGLDVGRLAIFRLLAEDRWFDDIVDNMRQRGR